MTKEELNKKSTKNVYKEFNSIINSVIKHYNYLYLGTDEISDIIINVIENTKKTYTGKMSYEKYLTIELKKYFNKMIKDLVSDKEKKIELLCNFINKRISKSKDVKEIQTYNSIVTLRISRLLLYAETVSILVELSYTISLRIIDVISKDSSFRINLCGMYCIPEHLTKTCSMEDVITKDKAGRVIANKLLTNNKCLGKSIW